MIWLDAHLSPAVARWLREELGRESQALEVIGARNSRAREVLPPDHHLPIIFPWEDRWTRCGRPFVA